MFVGEYRHQMDEKFRLRMPAKFKKQLGKNFVVTKGTNGCLFVFSHADMKAHLLDKLNNVSIFDINAQKPLRVLLSSAFEVEEDNQGRFLIDKALRDFANLKKDVVFIGVGNHIEVWNINLWENYLNADDSNFDALMGGLKDYGI
ncbi:MAG: division/cell wall cluster transcriptional repressor MraZ [Spirochaetales bacterium]